MVGLVIVSHSRQISDGVCGLAAQVWQGEQNIVSAGGLADGSFGTDALRILEAVQCADQGDGVLILCDFGSSILSAETAVELLGDGCRVRIADAPLVEGAVAAAVEAGGGSDLKECCLAAESARDYHKISM